MPVLTNVSDLSDVPKDKRFLLIKAWGCGFWSDFEHLLGQLLWAEVLKRDPVVYWGPESLYSNGCETDIFSKFFLPPSRYSIKDVSSEGFTYYPSIWNRHNLMQKEPNKSIRFHSRSWGSDFIGRSENIIVSDVHIYIDYLLPWVPEEHPVHGFAPIDAYRYVIDKYIKLQDWVTILVNEFYEKYMHGRTLLAIHARGGDRTETIMKLRQNNEEYFRAIEIINSVAPDSYLFLLTDSTFILDEFKKVFGERLMYTDCNRAEGSWGVHLSGIGDKERLALETIMDVYLAVKCDYFIGCNSNVSSMIMRLKSWEKDKALILNHLPSTRL